MSPIESHLPASGSPLDLEVSRLRKTYSTEPLIVDGIVGEGPQSRMAARVFGGGYRVHLFSFAAWKIGDQEVRTKELVLSRAIPNSDDFNYQLEKYSYHRINVLFSEESTRAIVLSGIETAQCPPDLSETADALRVPFVISLPRLGNLILDRSIALFSGRIDWNGSEIDISLTAAEESINPEVLRRSEQVMQSEGEIGQRVSEFLIESVLTSMAEYGSALEVDKSMFDLQGLHFSESGYVEFWYDDAGLWGGHSLVVKLGPDNGLDFSIEG